MPQPPSASQRLPPHFVTPGPWQVELGRVALGRLSSVASCPWGPLAGTAFCSPHTPCASLEGMGKSWASLALLPQPLDRRTCLGHPQTPGKGRVGKCGQQAPGCDLLGPGLVGAMQKPCSSWAQHWLQGQSRWNMPGGTPGKAGCWISADLTCPGVSTGLGC